VLRAGGAVLFASDAPNSLEHWLPGTERVQISGFRVGVAERQEAYRRQRNYPYLVPAPARVRLDPAQDVFQGLNRVVTEYPAHLTVSRFTGVCRYPLAGFPPSARHSRGAGM